MWKHLPRAAWSVATFGLGAYGWIKQVNTPGNERPFILLGCLLLMGFPVAQLLDVYVRSRNGTGKKDS